MIHTGIFLKTINHTYKIIGVYRDSEKATTNAKHKLRSRQSPDFQRETSNWNFDLL